MKKFILLCLTLLLSADLTSSEMIAQTNSPRYEPAASEACIGGNCPLPQSEASSRPNPAVVRIVVVNDRSRSYGSGTLVRDDTNYYFILTCAHLFENAAPKKITVLFPNSQSFEVRLLAIDRTWDLAILQNEMFRWPAASQPALLRQPCGLLAFEDSPAITRAGGGFHPLPPGMEIDPAHSPRIAPEPLAAGGIPPLDEGILIGREAPRTGDTLYYAGYGSNGQYQVRKGCVEGYCAVRETATAEMLVITGNARQGDSGGPIVNTRGELVGVLWGTDSRTVCATYNGRIYRFVRTAQQENRLFAPFTREPVHPQNPVTTPGKAETKPALSDLIEQLMTHYPNEVRLFMQGGIGGVSSENNKTYDEKPADASPVATQDALLETLERHLKNRVQDYAAEKTQGIVSSLVSSVLRALACTIPPAVAVMYVTHKVTRMLARRRRKKTALTGNRANKTRENTDY